MFVSDYRDRNHGLPPGVTFVEYQDKMVKGLKNISKNSQDMVTTLQKIRFYLVIIIIIVRVIPTPYCIDSK